MLYRYNQSIQLHCYTIENNIFYEIPVDENNKFIFQFY